MCNVRSSKCFCNKGDNFQSEKVSVLSQPPLVSIFCLFPNERLTPNLFSTEIITFFAIDS